MAQISVKISDGLRAHLEEAREASGRRLGAEIEARLRESLGAVSSDNLLLLRLDAGLMAHLRALAAVGYFGPVEETAVYLIRSEIIRFMSSEVWHRDICRHLPEPIRSACERMPIHNRNRVAKG